MGRCSAIGFLFLTCHSALSAESPPPTFQPLVRTVDLNIGESQVVELSDGQRATVKLLDLHETRDHLRNAIRLAEVDVEVNGVKVSLVSANYYLPVTVANVQIDCPVTRGYRQNSTRNFHNEDPWALDKDVRVRLWPAGSPLMNPGTFRYPARQRWFASGTQMANEPCHVDGSENPLEKRIYYHYGLDLGGAEGLVEVVAATDGLVISAGKEILPCYDRTPAVPRYDVVYVRDGRDWYYRYSHLHTIRPEVKPGVRVRMGQRIGLLGKEGGSGGWSHLHFDITSRQPSGKWGIMEGYAFLWEAYLHEYQPKLLAVARPHHLAAAGQKIILDGSRSWSASGQIASYRWTLADGHTATGTTVERVYSKPGVYSEVLQVTDVAGYSDYDFTSVNVLDGEHPERLPPTIHAAYYPTFDVQPGDPVTFLVRTFRTTDGKETWDFGDGSPRVVVQSDGNVRALAKDGYARTVHAYAKPGHYLARVERTDRQGYSAVAHLQVRVGGEAVKENRIVPENARLEKVWGAGEFTEGPAYGPGGHIYFSDIGNRILRYDPGANTTSVYREPSGRANGLDFDPQGRLVAAEGASTGGNRRITLTEKDGTVRVLADRWQGKRFNSPNDVTVDTQGRVYFTDPRYVGAEPREIGTESVYRIDPDGTVAQIITDVEKPNGIVLAPNMKALYLADSNPGGHQHLLSFPLRPDGTVGPKRLLHDFGKQRGIDGMCVDVEGNIYGAAGSGPSGGIYIFDPTGKQMGFIFVPETPTNCVFGGKDRKTLYITAGRSLYRIKLAIEGFAVYWPDEKR